MKAKYICPICQGHLDLNDKVVLIAKTKSGERGLIFLHTELGNYERHISSSIDINDGDCIDFLCPFCHSNIDYHKEKTDLAMLLQIDKKGRTSRVIFSKIYGEECTYHIDEDEVKTYGECAKKYMDPDWYLK
jgi:uncharacterized protein YbaR (Trm112 family)